MAEDTNGAALASQVEAQSARAAWGCAIGALIGICLIALFLLPFTGRFSHRNGCRLRLKQIGLALRTYHDVYQSLPPAFTVDETGRPMHSWRTLLLPFVEQQALYDSIDFSRPWDDPANSHAFNTAVEIYRCGAADLGKCMTSYSALVGDDSAFHPTRGRRLSEIEDGLWHTIFVVEVPLDASVHWMNPTDRGNEAFLALDLTTDTAHADGVQTVCGSGESMFVLKSSTPATRKALTTIAGNETISVGP